MVKWALQVEEKVYLLLKGMNSHTTTLEAIAEDGKVALRRFAGRPADLVISDIYMPDMDGLEMLMRLREAWPEARIITVSGGGHLDAEPVLEAAQALGAVATFTKPLDMEDVLAAVRGALGLETER